MIKAILLTYFIVNFDPLQGYLDGLFSVWQLKAKKRFRAYLDLIHISLGCYKCLGFWLGLVFTHDFYLACASSLISYFIGLCLQKMK